MKQTSIIIGTIGLILGVGYLVTSSNMVSEPLTTTSITPSTNISSAEAPIVESEQTTVTDTPILTSEAALSSKTPGLYTTYTADTIANSTADHILLFFKANWCPSCRALDADILAHMADIPAGVEIYTVDYDTATALKRQYGITRQHSIIEIRADGTATSDITHGLTLNDVLSTLN